MPGSGLRLLLRIVCALVAALSCDRAMAAAGQDGIVAAASDGHLWFVLDSTRKPGEFILCHHADDLGGPYYKPLMTLAQRPVTMAAWKSRLWLVYPPKTNGHTASAGDSVGSASMPSARRETFTLEAVRNPTLGVYSTEPAGRLDMLPALPGEGKLVGFIGTAKGPIALITPQQQAVNVATSPDQPAEGAAQAMVLPQLLRLVGANWEALPLPEGFRGERTTFLTSTGSEGERLVILTMPPGRADHALGFELDAEGSWKSLHVPLDLRSVHTALNAMGQIGLVLQPQSKAEIEFAYVRPELVVPLAAMAKPRGRWEVVATSDRFEVLDLSRDGALSRRAIDPLTGEANEPQTMTIQPMGAGRLWQFALVMGIIVAAGITVLLLKPGPQTQLALPAELQLLPVSGRLMEVMLDVAAAGLATCLLLRCSVSELIVLPLITADLSHSKPFLVMMLLTAGHCTVGELLGGASLGKAMLNAKVCRFDGTPAKWWQVLGRNIVKLFVLLIPPLGVITVMNPLLQGVHDMAGRTVVVHATAEDGDDDRSGRASPDDVEEEFDRDAQRRR